jgi:hypothetical protein
MDKYCLGMAKHSIDKKSKLFLKVFFWDEVVGSNTWPKVVNDLEAAY